MKRISGRGSPPSSGMRALMRPLTPPRKIFAALNFSTLPQGEGGLYTPPMNKPASLAAEAHDDVLPSLRPLVRLPGLASPRASACARGTRGGGQIRAPDRADRRRQDARRLPPEPPRSRFPRHAEKARAPHALHLALEGARRRREAQPRNAGRRNGPRHLHRDAHRRHAAEPPPAPAPRTARHLDDDAGAARPASLLSRRA